MCNLIYWLIFYVSVIMARRVPLLSSSPLVRPLESINGLTAGQQRFKNVIDTYSDIIEKASTKKRKPKKKKRSKPKKKNIDLRTMLRKERVAKPKKKGCKGVFLKGNPSVLAVLKKIPSMSTKIRDILPSREDGTCVSKVMTVQSLLRRVPGLKRKLHTLLKSGR